MGKIYAVRMREYNKGEGCLRRNWTAGQWGLQFAAGDSTPRRPFRPSPIVEVTKEQYEYIMGRRADGLPNVGQPHTPSIPVFQGWIVNSRRELLDMIQKEADARAAHGATSARAMLRLQGPIESETPVPKMIPPSPKEPVKEPEPEPVATQDAEPDFDPLDVEKELADAETPEREHSADGGFGADSDDEETDETVDDEDKPGDEFEANDDKSDDAETDALKAKASKGKTKSGNSKKRRGRPKKSE